MMIKAESFGRVNLIGEHTDYNGGWVLPTAIPQKTTIHLEKRSDQKVVATTDAHFQGASEERSYILGEETPQGSWIDYLQGATHILQSSGHSLGGFFVKVSSNVPTGSGLSSSAALEISFLKALREMFQLPLTDVELALIGQRIENEFVGAKVGIMDQMACAFANFGEALFLDTKKMEFERIQLPLDQMDLIVINSGLAHQHAGGDYNQRRSECEKACSLLKIHDLRELEMKDMPRLSLLPDVLGRRARHVVTENARVHEAVSALREGDMKKLGVLFYASHASMRDDYQISIPQIDALVEICREHPATFGARMTGGGFGGSIVAITEKDRGAEVAAAVCERYRQQMKEQPTILVPEAVLL